MYYRDVGEVGPVPGPADDAIETVVGEVEY